MRILETAKAAPIILLTLWATAAHSLALAQGYSPAESAGRMATPEGYSVSLVAAEPMIRQPVAMEFDDRGRLWVVQYLQYPNPAGLERVKWDRYSRTTYDRVPEPPPRGPRGADRITILTDIDGDGRADTAHDFLDGLNLASGIALGHGGVFVLQVPYLLFYADRDGDDVPDGDPDVLLTGFGMEDAHSVANSLTWGPDGWLYGAQGSTVTANIRGIEFQQGVWRYHPVSRRFELFYEGGGNTWGLDFDARGHLFASTNHGGFAFLHGVQGGYYWKSFGKHGALHNPHAYGYFEHVSHADLSGGHVTVGGLIYRGQMFPESMRGAYIGANLLSHTVFWHELAREGTTFRARQAGTLLDSRDTWFAPSDVTVGPDGAVYVADWHDQRTAHPDPDAEWDRSNGRIYRIAFGEESLPTPPNVQLLANAKLIASLDHPSAWYRTRARMELARRGGDEIVSLLRERLTSADEIESALEYLWTLESCGGLDDVTLIELTAHRFADVRRWAVRLAGDREQPTPAILEKLVELARREDNADVRSQLASTAARLPEQQALKVVAVLAERDRDADDPHIPLLCWWALERHCVAARDVVLEHFTRNTLWQSALAREHLLGRLMRRYAAEGSDHCFAACAELYRSAPADARQEMLVNFDRGLAARQLRDAPPDLLAAVLDDWTSTTRDALQIRVLARLGHGQAVQRAAELASEEQSAPDLRAAMMRLLSQVGYDAAVPGLLDTLASGAPQPVQLAAVDALAGFDDLQIAERLVDMYASLPSPLQSKLRDVLFARPQWALTFLRAVDSGELDPGDVPLEQLRRLAVHDDPTLNQLVYKRWGRVEPASPGEKLAEVRRLNNDLRAADGEPQSGHALFGKHCASCHRLFGHGEKIGPDLTPANRGDRGYLLEHIVDPSALVRKEYMSHQLLLDDGRVLTGMVLDESPAELVLADNRGERMTVSRDRIAQLEPAPLSLMPEGLLQKLTPQQVRDLFAYLQSSEPLE